MSERKMSPEELRAEFERQLGWLVIKVAAVAVAVGFALGAAVTAVAFALAGLL